MNPVTTIVENNPTCTHSGAAEVIISLVPILGVVLGATLLFFFLLWQYQLRRELIKTGQYQPRFWEHIRSIVLLIGSISAFIGLPMFLLFWALNGLSYSLLGGLIPLFAGLGMLAFYFISGKGKEP